MKQKIYVLVMTLVFCLSTIVIVLNDVDVEATAGGGGQSGEIGEIIGLDLDYMWEVTDNLSNVIHNKQVYPDGSIPKGRAFGTAGDNWTAEYLKREMDIEMGLDNVEKLPIGPIEDIKLINRYYSSRINITEFSLCINNENYTSETDGFPNVVPLNESFVTPSCKPKNIIGGSLTDNFTFLDEDDIRLFPVDDKWPNGVFRTGFHLNITITFTWTNYSVMGNTSYINNTGTLPEEQNDTVFLIHEDNNCDDKLENVTNASAIILLYNSTSGIQSENASNCTFPIVRINDTDSNLTILLDKIANETVLVDSSNCTLNLTFRFNLSCFPTWPEYNFVCLGRNAKPGGEDIPSYGDWKDKTYFLRLLNKLSCYPFNTYKCKGVILYDSYNETHFMNNYNPPLTNGGWFRLFYAGPSLPMFAVNGSVGKWLIDHTNKSNTTITGYVNQEYQKEKHLGTPSNWKTGTEAYNVEGEINIDNSPGDARICISNRYDGWWSEAPFDSGAGAGVVLGIAKYFSDYDITPKYNLTFLFTTGEELLYRGAQHYSDSHKDTNFTYWIGFDMIGINYPNTTLSLYYEKNDDETRKIIENITHITQYYKRTGFKNDTQKSTMLTGAEDFVWNKRHLPIHRLLFWGSGSDFQCKTICFVKDAAKTNPYRHRTGNNYEEGDSMKNMNRSDLNVSFELAWNITKYFAVWPDCWFHSTYLNLIDTDDDDTLKDTVTVNFYAKSSVPHDLVMANISIWRATSDEFVVSKLVNFSARNLYELESFNVTIPENEQAGFFTYSIKLYNSTDRINSIVGIGGDIINDTIGSDFFFLYPYNTDYNIPKIANVTANPDPVGFGQNVTISADVTSNVSDIDVVSVSISYPDDTFVSFNMTNTVDDTYEYVFNDTWQHGQYDYAILAKDVNGNESGSSTHDFDVSVDATISICTVKDSYGSNEIINITDPPVSSYLTGYELLDDGDVLHIWNNLDNYYFDTDSGIQLTNHYNEYWSHNVLMLGYYNNDEWNLIYRTDELNGFNKDIESDNESYVTATLWKDLNYAGYDFRLAIRYHLGVDDNELTVIPYIKNIDNEDIPYNLGFAWEIKDIQIDMTEEDDYIEIDGTTYYLNEEDLDETYTNMDVPSFYIKEDTGDNEEESLYLRWDENLNYKVQVKSRSGQYNAPVTLGIKIGTLDVDQEKSTEIFWYDACKATYFYISYNAPFAWETNPSNMVDGNTSNYASTTTDREIETLDGNTFSDIDKGPISKVEIRCFGKYSGNEGPPIHEIRLKALDGVHVFSPTTTGNWSSWYDITNNPGAPSPWTWTFVKNLNVDVESSIIGLYTVYCSKVEVRVTYNAYPAITNPYPVTGATAIPITPVMNLTVSDANGDTMNITWWSNSSGSWQVFGTNNSVSNGTYHQTFSNATVNGQWWYWKYNVSDGTNHIESNALSFYTGYKSKIENTGSTNFSGYLLIQIDYYNTTSTAWELDQIVNNETTPRTINVDGVLGLDTIFNPQNVNTNSLSNGDGTYRVYTCLRDPDYDILNIGSELVANYQFTVTFD